MGTNFCVCNDGSNQEKESNIFSGMQNNKCLEKETIRTLSFSDNQTLNFYTNKSFQDYKSNNNNCGLNILTNEMKKNDNYNFFSNSNNNNTFMTNLNKNDNFQCSGKFNVLMSNQKTSNGAKENYDNNSLNNSDKNSNKGNNEKIISNNAFSFNNLKTFIDGNNNIAIRYNKDNNIDNEIYNEIYNNQKPNNANKKNEKNNIQNVEQNSKENINDKIISNRYNNISQYDDESDKDYLNNESNYYNSNKREENRNIEISSDHEEN